MAGAVDHSQLITTVNEARAYYAERLAGAHKIQSAGRDVTIVFERGATHLYSVEVTALPVVAVTRRLGVGRIEAREFSLERARLMDEVLRAVSLYTVSVPGTGGRGRENRMVHGRRLASGQYLRVVLRPGPGDAWTCVSAYPVTEATWMQARRAKSARFPP
ncbi:MAG: hypothetical protein WCJ30_07045 [Deltaproteobacteria bacterium]